MTTKPIYQVWRSTDSCREFYSWDDCDKEDYDKAHETSRRLLYAADEIERLTAELTTCQQELREARDSAFSWAAKAESAEAKITELQAKLTKMEDEWYSPSHMEKVLSRTGEKP